MKYIIYGGGQFGELAFKSLKPTDIIVVIDSDKNCLLSKDLELINLSTLKNSQNFFASHLKSLIIGGIKELIELIVSFSFDYLLPMAPIHVMQELIYQYLIQTFPAKNFSKILPLITFSNIPDEIFLFREAPLDIFLSYANWTEICPSHCNAPLDFCLIHNRKKPITVANYIEKLFQNFSQREEQMYMHFESYQLGPGIGGIQISYIEQILKKLIMEIDNQEGKKKNLTLIIATTCNCHGVVSAIEMKL